MNDREVDHGVRVDWRFAGQIIRDPIILAEDLAEMGFPDSNVASRCNRYAMFRGRKPGRGAVLMAKGDFDAIPHPQRCQHSLAITCENTVVVRRLCVTRVEVLAPNILQNAKKEPIGVTPESPCIVEIADARHYAPMTSIMRSFNWRSVTGRHRGCVLSYRDLCEAIWLELQDLFGGLNARGEFEPAELTFSINDPVELQSFPEQLGFQGMNAWEALWIVLDLAGWSFTLLHDGTPRVFNPKLVSESQLVFNQIQASILGRRSRYDTLAEPVHAALPEKIRAVTRQREFQWYQDPIAEALHSGDMVDRFPMFEAEFDSKELLLGIAAEDDEEDQPILGDEPPVERLNLDGRLCAPPPAPDKEEKQEDAGPQQSARLLNLGLINTKEFVPGTKHVVYGTVPFLTDDSTAPVNADAVLDDLRFVATRYLRKLARIDQGSTWVYSLLWPFFPNSHVSAVGYTDVGGAFTMTVKIGDDEAIDWKGNELSFNAELVRPGNPGWRDPVPYGRELYGVLIDHFPTRRPPLDIPGRGDGSPGLDDDPELIRDPLRQVQQRHAAAVARAQQDGPPTIPDLPPPTLPGGGTDPVELDPNAPEVIPPLPDRWLGVVAIMSGHESEEQVQEGPSGSDVRDQKTVIWRVRDVVMAYNGTGRPIRMNRRVYAKWNYQVGTSGAWVIVSATGDRSSTRFNDWEMACLKNATTVGSATDPGRIEVDKRRMLKLVIPEGVKQESNPDAIGISMFNGPDCSVLSTRLSNSEECPMVWDDSPCLVNLSVKCWIRFDTLLQTDPRELPPFGDSQQAIERSAVAQAAGLSPHVTWLGPSRLSSLRMRLPPAPHRSHKFLISGPSQGSDTELMWAGPGYSGYMEVKLLDDTPVGLTFEYGLLVASTYPVMQAAPKVYGVDFAGCPPTRFNPCSPCNFEGETFARCRACTEEAWPDPMFIRIGKVEFQPRHEGERIDLAEVAPLVIEWLEELREIPAQPPSDIFCGGVIQSPLWRVPVPPSPVVPPNAVSETQISVGVNLWSTTTGDINDIGNGASPLFLEHPPTRYMMGLRIAVRTDFRGLGFAAPPIFSAPVFLFGELERLPIECFRFREQDKEFIRQPNLGFTGSRPWVISDVTISGSPI